MPYFAGVDVGGTSIKAGVVDDTGLALSSVSLATEAFKGQLAMTPEGYLLRRLSRTRAGTFRGGGAKRFGEDGVEETTDQCTIALSHQFGQRLYRTRGGHGRRASVRRQLLEQRPSAKSLRPMPQCDVAGTNAELRAQRRCESGLCAGQHRRQLAAAIDVTDRGQGDRRPQLLVVGS